MKSLGPVVLIAAVLLSACGTSTSSTGDGPSDGGDGPRETPTPEGTATPPGSTPMAQLRVENFLLTKNTIPADAYEPNDASAKFLGGPGFIYDLQNGKIEPIEASFKVDVVNAGNEAATAFDVDLFLGGAPTAAAQRGAQTQTVPSLPAGAATSLTFTVNAGDAVAALKAVAKLDAVEAIAETDEADNVTSELLATLAKKDVDWFSIDQDQGFTIQIQLDNLPADYDVELYSQNGTKVAASGNDGTTAEAINYTAGATQRYYLKVFGFQGAASDMPYRLRVTVN